jgi:hypothetical protein
MRTILQSSVYLFTGVAMLCLGMLLPSPAAEAVVLDDETRETIVLDDGTTIILYAQAGSQPGRPTSNYYYLPANLRLSQRPDGTPEFLFLKFTTEQRADQGGISGGLMHFLMTWGLNAEQEQDLAAKLKKKNRRAVLKGAAPLEPDDSGGSFRIVSATLEDDSLTPSVVSSGKAPLIPGGKAAAASRLTAEGAQLLAATFEKSSSITDVSLVLSYSFTTLAPAARGYIEVDWSKVQHQSETLEAQEGQVPRHHRSRVVEADLLILLRRDAAGVRVPAREAGDQGSLRPAARW